jgi:subtilase family serine protease
VVVALPFPMDDRDLAAALPGRLATAHLPSAQVSVTTPPGAQGADVGCGTQPSPPTGSDDCGDGWHELFLDIATILEVAPQAHVLVVTAPRPVLPAVNSLDGVMGAIAWIVAEQKADVISMSFDRAEALPGFAAHVGQIDEPLHQAFVKGIPVVAASGDCGSTDSIAIDAGFGCDPISPDPTVAWPASNPYVIAVGAQWPTAPDPGSAPLWFNSGAGLSRLYPRPQWQAPLASITESTMRSLPDLVMPSENATSEAAARLAGLLALATEAKHRESGGPLGQVLPALYRLGGRPGAGIIDVSQGSNTYQMCAATCTTVPGFTAKAGFDVASGWGTVDPGAFIPALVATLAQATVPPTAPPTAPSAHSAPPSATPAASRKGDDHLSPYLLGAGLACVVCAGLAVIRRTTRPRKAEHANS